MKRSLGRWRRGRASRCHVLGATDPGDCGTLSNTATVSAANEPESAAANNSATATIVINCPDVTVTKTADAEVVSAGDVVGFSVVVSNLGPAGAVDVTLSDVLPAGVTWSLEPVSGCVINGGTLDCSLGTMPPGSSVTVHVLGATDPGDLRHPVQHRDGVRGERAPIGRGHNSATARITVAC